MCLIEGCVGDTVNVQNPTGSQPDDIKKIVDTLMRGGVNGALEAPQYMYLYGGANVGSLRRGRGAQFIVEAFFFALY